MRAYYHHRDTITDVRRCEESLFDELNGRDRRRLACLIDVDIIASSMERRRVYSRAAADYYALCLSYRRF